MAWNFIVQLAVLVVTTAISIALAPKPERPKPAALSDFDLPTADPSRPIPIVFGTWKVKGPNVVWYGNLRTIAIRKKGGKK